MGCKDDDTCDLPATKGEIENLRIFNLMSFLVVLGAVGFVGYMMENAKYYRTNHVLTILQAMEGMKLDLMRR